MKKKVIVAILCVVLAISCVSMLFACDSKTGLEDGTLNIATNCEFEPFEYLDDQGKPTGIDMDIVTAIAKELKVKVEIKDMAFESVVSAVGSGSQDLAAAGLTVDEERKQSVDFTKSYFNSNQVVIAKNGNVILSLTDKAKVEEMLSGKKIGVQNGTTGYKYASGDSDDYNGVTAAENVKGFASGALAVQALLNGQVDYVIIDAVPAEKLCVANDGITASTVVLTGEEYAFAVKKGNSKLLKQIDDALAKLIENGTIEEIFQKYGLNSGLNENVG